MKVTYCIKGLFLVFSWFILFNGLENANINSQIFFTSVLIYTGAIIFDLIFLAIESFSKSDEGLKGVYVSSLILIVLNGLICCIEFIGAMGGLEIARNSEEILMINIVPCGLTEVFTTLQDCSYELRYFMILVILFGIISILPGLLSLKNKDRVNVNKSNQNEAVEITEKK